MDAVQAPAMAARAHAAPSAQRDAVSPSPWPLVTGGLIAALAIVYGFELLLGVEPLSHGAISLRSSIALGGVDGNLVLHEGEWWRLFTAPWLHQGPGHLIGNAVTLAVAGAALERRVGSAWLAVMFMLGALGGSIGSLAYNPGGLVSVGASGAIMCLVSALYMLSYHYETGKQAVRLRRRALFVLIPALLPSAAHGGAQIDYGAHFGGFCMGAAIGFAFLIRWPETGAPAGAGIARRIAPLGVLVALLSFILVGTHYQAYAARSAALLPLSDYGSDGSALMARSGELVAQYPHDPAIRLIRAMDLARQKRFGEAERNLRAGLIERETLQTEFAPVLEDRLQIMLALMLLAEGKRDESARIGHAACAKSQGDEIVARAYALLKKQGICD